MRTWSIASCIDRVTIAVVDAQAFAAVAVQGLIDAAHTVERVSRPVRRERDGAEELADKEAEEECSEPRLNDGLTPFDPQWTMTVSDGTPPCTCPCINCCNQAHWMCHGEGVEIDTVLDDDEIPTVPGVHNASDRLCAYANAAGTDPLAICGVCRPVRDIVEQMIEERFGGQVDKADKLDAEMWRAYVRSQSTPAASAVGSSSPAACDIPPVARRGVLPWSDLADRMAEHLPSAKVQDGIDSAASTFPQHRKHLK